MWPVDKHGAEAGSGGHQAAPDVLPRPPAAPLPPLGLRSASKPSLISRYLESEIWIYCVV